MSGRLGPAWLWMLCLGCGQGPTTSSVPAQPTADSSTAAARSEADNAGPDAPADSDRNPGDGEGDLTAVLQELTQLVRRYGVEQRRVPATLQDLVPKGYLSAVPKAPAGRKFAINKQLQVYLANE